MKSILTGGFMAGVMAAAAMAEGERRPGVDEKRPPGSEQRPRRDGEMRPPHAKPEDMFKHMDRDRDGKISKREFFASPRMERLPAEQREAIFGRLDRNGDAFLGPEEIRAMRRDNERRMKEGFRKLDTDKSGGLSFDEFSKGELFGKLPEEKRRQIFTRMDTDGNGEINRADKPKGPPSRPERSERRSERDPME
jgi:Ca2+-binding EF-hand superfamily protein